jgi:hypothetical protein
MDGTIQNRFYKNDGITLREKYRVKTCRNCCFANVGALHNLRVEIISCTIKGDLKPGCPYWQQRIPKPIHCTTFSTGNQNPVTSVYYEY